MVGAQLPAEQELTEQLVDDLVGRLKADPGMHVYHCAAYEQTALKRLTGRHGTRESELDTLLRGERFVDLYAVVRTGIRISKPSYSIKSSRTSTGVVRARPPRKPRSPTP